MEISGGLLDLIGKEGTFAIGVLWGCLLSYFMFRLASAERIQRHKLDLEREQQLLSQLKIKDERIDALHKKLEAPKGGKGS
jgi:hypothetical protein